MIPVEHCLATSDISTSGESAMNPLNSFVLSGYKNVGTITVRNAIARLETRKVLLVVIERDLLSDNKVTLTPTDQPWWMGRKIHDTINKGQNNTIYYKLHTRR